MRPTKHSSLVFVALVALSACQSAPEPSGSERAPSSLSPTAQPEIVQALRADLAAVRHPSDGAGKVSFTEPPAAVVAGTAGSWSFAFETGESGIALGGWLFFQAPPFWHWSTPQVIAPNLPGYTEVRTEAAGVEIEASTLDQQLLGVEIQGRGLRAGETITIHYGAGPAGAIADRFAERRSCFYFAVDGDGDGIRGLLDEQPCVDVVAGPAARLLLTLPSTARPEEGVPLTLAVLDRAGNRVEDWQGEVDLVGSESLEVPDPVSFSAEDEGAIRTRILPTQPGVHRVSGRIVGSEIVARSNPVLIETDARAVFWADLHGHSGLSDGTGTARDYFRFARDVAALDAVALTDHDHWGMEPLAVHPELWEEIRRETELFHRPGSFVTLLGYEWTSWLHGHRHVLYFSGEGKILSSVDPDYESPLQLWAGLRGQDALTFAHHSAGGPVATNWQIPPDPELEPVTEIVSVHGSSEALDSAAPIYSPVPGNFVRDVLDRGYRLGFVGSGDGHDGHPGLAHLGAPSGGVAAILATELSRASIKTALQERRAYATNGPRILLRTEFAGRQMGAGLRPQDFVEVDADRPELSVDAIGASSLATIELVRTGAIVDVVDCQGQLRCVAELDLEDLIVGEYFYVRVLQEDGGAAWSSPYFIVD